MYFTERGEREEGGRGEGGRGGERGEGREGGEEGANRDNASLLEVSGEFFDAGGEDTASVSEVETTPHHPITRLDYLQHGGGGEAGVT